MDNTVSIACEACHEDRCDECTRPAGYRLAADDRSYPVCCCGRWFRTEDHLTDEPGRITKLTGPNSIHRPGGCSDDLCVATICDGIHHVDATGRPFDTPERDEVATEATESRNPSSTTDDVEDQP